MLKDRDKSSDQATNTDRYEQPCDSIDSAFALSTRGAEAGNRSEDAAEDSKQATTYRADQAGLLDSPPWVHDESPFYLA
jgi:hypothetical protein